MLRKAGDLSRENWSEISLSMFGERKTSSRMPRQAAVVVAGAPNLLRSHMALLHPLIGLGIVWIVVAWWL